MAQKLHSTRDTPECESRWDTAPLMNAIAYLKGRFIGRSDSEHEQALLRLGIVAFFAFEMYLYVGPKAGWTATEQVLSAGLFGFRSIAIGIFAAIGIWPRKNITRRIVGMLSDVGGATFYVWLAGENGVWMICVYLFVTFGNGFRYGRRYLFACQTLCLLGFFAAGYVGHFSLWRPVPYWELHHTEWLGTPNSAICTSTLRFHALEAHRAGP